ncbi:MAG: DUF1292 domain-containing protein [Clostridia bacterium]|nr:DUF1292 domain-containing protein [Clostridia bacterium]
MAEELNNTPEEFDSEIYTLTDEDGNDAEFELLAQLEDNGITYLAMAPLDETSDEDEYVVLKVELDENGEETVVSVEDDDEFERIADMFDDLFAEMD